MGYSLLRGRRMRVTKVDGCGSPVLGPDSQLVTKGFVSIALTANNETGTAITVTNANGEQCVNDTPLPRFTGFTAVLTFCGVDPELIHLLTGNPLVLDADDNPIGFDDDTGIDIDLLGFALEAWTGIAVDACDESGDTPYGYMVFPFFKGGTVGDVTIQNDAINFVVQGAVTRNGSQWGVGPYDVMADESGNPGPLLTPLSNKNHRRVIRTTVAPPDETDGAGALGSMATGATAGTPGTWTPPNSYAPLNLAELTTEDPTASPATAWTTGQSVILRDGSRAHWNGTAWVAGVA